MKPVLSLAAVLFIAACTVSNNGDTYTPPGAVTVSGSVRHALTGDVVVAAKVTLGEARLITESEGIFTFDNVETGTRLLRVEAAGFKTLEQDIQVGFAGLHLDLLVFPEGATTGSGGAAEAPVLASVTPASAQAGDTVVITGAKLGASAGGSQVLFGGVAGQIVSWSDTTVSAIVPPTLGSGMVAVIVVVGGAASNSLALTVNGTSGAGTSPILSALSVGSGEAGTLLTLTGADFGASQGASSVTFSGITAQVSSWTDTAITVIVPPSLAPGATTVVVVVSGKASGGKPFTVVVPAQTAPAAPNGVTAQAGGAFQATVRWNDLSTDETSFSIRRKTGVAAFAEVARVGANANQFTDFSVDEQVSYTYRVCAVNDAGTTCAPLDAVVVTPASTTGGGAPAAPAAPSALSATLVSSYVISLGWTSNSGGAESGFWIQRRINGGSFTWLATVGSGVVAYTDDSAAPGNQYEYRVRAFNAGGNSAYVSGNLVNTPQVVPLAPANLVATALSATEVFVTWSDYANNETGYVVERQLDAGAFQVVAALGAGAVGYDDTSVQASKLYTYRVRAANAQGSSAYSQLAAVYTPDVMPAAPTGLSAVAQTNKLYLTWLDNSANELGFRVYRSEAGGPFGLVATLNANVTTYDDITARSGLNYTYRIAAYNTAGENMSAGSASETAPVMPPNAPANLAVSALSSTQALLTWTNGANVGTDVRVMRALGNGAFSQVALLTANSTVYIDGSAAASTLYRWQVVQYSGMGTAASNIVTYTMPAPNTGGGGTGTPPNAPTNLTAVFDQSYLASGPTNFVGGDLNYDDGQNGTVQLGALVAVQVRWNDNSSNEYGFLVERSRNGGAWMSFAHLQPNTNFGQVGSIDGLLSFRVNAYGAGGASAFSNTVTSYVLFAPGNVKAIPRAADGLMLTWLNGSLASTGTVIERSENNGGTWASLATVSPWQEFYVDSSAVNRTSYIYRLRNTDGLTYSPAVTLATGNFYWEPQWPSRALSAVWTLNATTTFAVGGDGSIQKYDGALWKAMGAPNVAPLWAVWGASATDVWAAGDRGVILHYNGVKWERLISPVLGNIHAIHGAAANDVWFVGSSVYHAGTHQLSSTVMHWNGSTLTAVPVPTDYSLNGVWAASTTDAWAVGSYGTILRWNGSAWSAVASPATENLNTVTGTGSNEVFVGGNGGRLMRFNGTGWQAISLPILSADVQVLTAAPFAPLYARFSDGSIWAYNGGWTFQFHDWDTTSIHASGASNIVAVGYVARLSNGVDWSDISFAWRAAQIKGASSRRVVVADRSNFETPCCSGALDYGQYYGYDGSSWTKYPVHSVTTTIEVQTFAVRNDELLVLTGYFPSPYYTFDGATWAPGAAHSVTEASHEFGDTVDYWCSYQGDSLDRWTFYHGHAGQMAAGVSSVVGVATNNYYREHYAWNGSCYDNESIYGDAITWMRYGQDVTDGLWHEFQELKEYRAYKVAVGTNKAFGIPSHSYGTAPIYWNQVAVASLTSGGNIAAESYVDIGEKPIDIVTDGAGNAYVHTESWNVYRIDGSTPTLLGNFPPKDCCDQEILRGSSTTNSLAVLGGQREIWLLKGSTRSRVPIEGFGGGWWDWWDKDVFLDGDANLWLVSDQRVFRLK